VLQRRPRRGVSSRGVGEGTPTQVESFCGNSQSTNAAVSPRPERTRRGTLIRRAAVASAVAIGGFSLLGNRTGSAGAAPSAAQDETIFNFALLLEYLQAGFYGQAVDRGRLKGEVREFAEIVAQHERDHVVYLQKALGARARRRPRFDFRGATADEKRFLEAAVLLENTGVAAYNGQAANLTKKALAAAVEIVSVEGRHAAWVSDLAGLDPAPRAADPGASASAVAATIARTGFIQVK
jgi:rubrerythrin